jgi:8-oxo-dGTP diphosphatase
MESGRFTVPVAVHLLLLHRERDKILLLRRFNTGYEDGKYSVIAGHLDGGEEIREAMIREAYEEAGIDLSIGDLLVVLVMHRKDANESIDVFLTSSTWTGKIINKEPNKCDQLAWFDLKALPENVIPYIRKAIDDYLAGIQFDSFGWPNNFGR